MKFSDYYCYPAVVTFYEDGGTETYFPDLDVYTCNDDDSNLVGYAKELLTLTMYGLEEDGEPIPKPTPLNKLKVGENEKSILVDVFMPPFRLKSKNKSVKKTLSIPAWMNEMAMEHDINFSQVLQEGLKRELNIK